MKGNMKLKLAIFAFIVLCNGVTAQNNSKFKVVLDPGHGAKDYGAIYHGFIEKNIALSVALKVGALLEKDPEVDVVYTRKTDVFIELNERANIANNAKASIFVSIHCNGAVNQTAYGTETFIMGTTRNASNLEVAKKENDVISLEKDYKLKYEGYDPKKPESVIGLEVIQQQFNSQSIELASRIETGISTNLDRKSRGVKQAGFLVLRNIYMPRVLVELGFISNKPEGEFLNSEAGQDKLAAAIANAILNYKKEYFIPGEESRPSTPITQTIPVVKPDNDSRPVQQPVTKSGLEYKVQIAASGKVLELVPSNFKGLTNLSKDDSTNVIKYYYGATSDKEKAKALLEEAKAKGYTSSFIVTFKDGKRI